MRITQNWVLIDTPFNPIFIENSFIMRIILYVFFSLIVFVIAYSQSEIDWSTTKASDDFNNLTENLESLILRLDNLINEDADLDPDLKSDLKTLQVYSELAKRNTSDLMQSLNSNDETWNQNFETTITDLNKLIDDLRAQLIEERSKDVDAQTKKLADAVVAEIKTAIDEVKDIGNYQERFNIYETQIKSLNKKLEDNLVKINSLTVEKSELIKLASSDDISEAVAAQIRKLKDRDWSFSVGFIGLFNDRAQDGDYFVNTDSTLSIEPIDPSFTLNLGLLLGYKFGPDKRLSIQTSIPILSYISGTESDNLSTFVKRTSGAIGIGYRPFRDNKRFNVIMLINAGTVRVIKPGSQKIYLEDKTKVDFAVPGTTIDIENEEFSDLFRNRTRISFGIGISIALNGYSDK